MFETTVADGVCRLVSERTRWLATGWNGGYHRADTAYNLTVPTGFERTDLANYVTDRLADTGFDGGPALLTGVDQRHARGARAEDVTVVATAGLSNPATLPVAANAGDEDRAVTDEWRPGTVNLLVGTTRTLDDGTLATLLATAVEAKTATLQALTGFTGTTSDAVVVGTAPGGDPADFAGSASAVGDAARACVRDALRATLAARYTEETWPETVADAEYGVVTDRGTEAFSP
jgi:adenosylcobinamide hydrolase